MEGTRSRCSTHKTGEQWRSEKRGNFRIDIREGSLQPPPYRESKARAGAGTVGTRG